MNYYDVLRVDKNASSQEIKDSYKKLIKRYHPDLYPGNKKKAEAITRDLNEAYETLSDPDKRAMYNLSLQPTIEKYQQQYSSPAEKYRTKFHQNNNFHEEPHIPSWEDKFSQDLHSFIDKKTEKLSLSSKRSLVFIIIILALVILLITTNDFMNLHNSLTKRRKLENTVQRREKSSNSMPSYDYYDDLENFKYYDNSNNHNFDE